MKAAVVYASMTGKTKKVAKAMAAALGVKAVPVKEAAQCKEADLLFLGSGIYGGKLSPELLEFAKTLQPDRVKKVAAVSPERYGSSSSAGSAGHPDPAGHPGRGRRIFLRGELPVFYADGSSHQGGASCRQGLCGPLRQRVNLYCYTIKKPLTF